MRRLSALAMVLLVALSIAGCTSTSQVAPARSTTTAASDAGMTTVSYQAASAGMGAQKLTAADLVVRLQSAGLTANGTGPLPKPLFGAVAVEGISIQGIEGTVYVFEDRAAATKGLAIASNPQANTVSWAVEPSFFQLENLLLVVATKDGSLTAKITSALK